MADVEYDFDNTCRTCLTYSTELQSIFEICGTTALPVQLTSLIMSIAKVEISRNDGMPDKICNLCKTAVHQAYLYKFKCEESDFKLRKYVEKKCQNLDIKEELQEYVFELETDLAMDEALDDPLLLDDPLQHPNKVNLNIIADVNKTVRQREELIDESVQCTICSKDIDKKSLSNHMKLHSNFMCASCDQTFATQIHLNLHMQSHLKMEHGCEGYVESSPNQNSLKVHESTVTSEKQAQPSKRLQLHKSKHKIEQIAYAYDSTFCSGPNGKKYCQCKLCDTKFSKISALNTHMVQHWTNVHSLAEIDFTKKLELFDGLNLDADPANQTNESLIQLVQHQLSIGANQKFYQILNKNSWEMNLSDSETDSETDSESEVDSNRTATQCHQCSKCDQSFDRSWKVFRHMTDDHPSDEFDHKCSYCCRKYPNSVLLEKHLRTQCENTFKKFICHLCGIKFMWKSSCNGHIEKMHLMEIRQKTSRMFANDKCLKTLSRDEHLERRKKVHLTAEKKFTCVFCQSEFNSKDNLKHHLLSSCNRHVDNKKKLRSFACDICGSTFYRDEHLESHKKVHLQDKRISGDLERKFSCNLCKKKFTRKHNLQYHLRAQTCVYKEDGEKHICVYCDSPFSNSSNLAVHMRRHTGEKPHKCDLCDKGFLRASDLRFHKRTHTGEKISTCTICGKDFSFSHIGLHMRIHTVSVITDSSVIQCHDVTDPTIKIIVQFLSKTSSAYAVL